MTALSRRRGPDMVANKASQKLMAAVHPLYVVWLRQCRRVFLPVVRRAGHQLFRILQELFEAAGHVEERRVPHTPSK